MSSSAFSQKMKTMKNNPDIALAQTAPETCSVDIKMTTMQTTMQTTTQTTTQQPRQVEMTNPMMYHSPPSLVETKNDRSEQLEHHQAVLYFPSCLKLVVSVLMATAAAIAGTISWYDITKPLFMYTSVSSSTNDTNVTAITSNITSLFPGRWEHHSTQTCCEWTWNQDMNGDPVSENDFGMTNYVLARVPSGIGFVFISYFIIGFFGRWLSSFSRTQLSQNLATLLLALPVFALLWAAFDAPPPCTYTLDDTSLYEDNELEKFCGYSDSIKNRANGSSVSLVEEQDVYEHAALPLNAPAINMRETSYCVDESSAHRLVGSDKSNNGQCEVVHTSDPFTCSFQTGDSTSWYSNPGRASLGMTAAEVGAVIDIFPIFVDILFEHMFEKGSRKLQYEKCYQQLLNSVCVALAPVCLRREVNAGCRPNGRHCKDHCASFVDCSIFHKDESGVLDFDNAEQREASSVLQLLTQGFEERKGQSWEIFFTIYQSAVRKSIASAGHDHNEERKKFLLTRGLQITIDFFQMFAEMLVNINVDRAVAVTSCERVMNKYSD